MAVDWQEPMVLQCKLRPSIACVNVQLDPRHAVKHASKHTTAPINRTRPSPRKLSPDGAARAMKHTSDYSLLLSLSTSKGRKAESTRRRLNALLPTNSCDKFTLLTEEQAAMQDSTVQ